MMDHQISGSRHTSGVGGRGGGRTIDERGSGLTPISEDPGYLCEPGTERPICRGVREQCLLTGEAVCVDCQFLHDQNLVSEIDLEFLRRCRAIRRYIDQGYTPSFTPYIAVFLVTATGRILDIDECSTRYVRSAREIAIRHNRLIALDSEFNEQLLQAISKVAASGKAETLVTPGSAESASRYAILLQANSDSGTTPSTSKQAVACLIFPLGRRRVASAKQLMTMFRLTGAEARLARALCHGDTLEEYATGLSIKISTVKTQLRAVFAKTQTDRQVSLVNLIMGIPPLR